MRIIGGKDRGRRLFVPEGHIIRPTSDRIRESIFNILSHSKKIKIDLVNSNVLDLFSGVGSFGIECLSRGVKKVTFVENYKNVLPVLKKNISNLNYQDNVTAVSYTHLTLPTKA